MKYIIAPLLISLASAGDCDYKPGNDVTDHSKSAVDALKLKEAVNAGDTEKAMEIYTNPTTRSSKTPQGLATKDWAGAGAPDEIYQDYVAVLGENFLDGYNIDAINCSGQFEGQSSDICKIAAVKNALCSSLSYALYEFAKSGGDAGSEKNWDEGFAFWHGLYDEPVDGVDLGSNSAAAVQSSRDSNYKTDHKGESCQRIKNGQDADKAAKKKELEGIAASIAATFSQATLKYAAEMLVGEDQALIDKKWGEGYTYFRCGAGLMDKDLAMYIEKNFSPLTNDQMTDDTVLCGIASKMAETKDLGYGISMGDLELTNFETLADLETRCSITIPVASMELASSSAIKSAGLLAVGAIAAVIALV